MQATLETLEPVIRPAAVKSATRPVRSPRSFGFNAVQAPALFHAWRA